jgi:hypothetical protein
MTLVSAIAGLALLLALPGYAAARDRNHDRISDRWEKRHHLSLKVNQARRDQDHDGLRNRGEFLAEDRPHDADTDNDATEDGDENAGTIESFNSTTGVLVIDLFNGGSVSGLVNSQTEIECEGADENDLQREGDNSGPGSENSGPGSESSGPGDGEGCDDDGNCTADDLVPGAVVHEAELELENGDAVFEEIELVS